MEYSSKKFRAVLFDLDGVLVDMREAHYEALNLALLSFGVKIEEDEHTTIFNGLPSRKKLALLAAEGRILLSDAEAINSMKQEFTRQIIPRICTPHREHIDLMKELNNAGFKIGCCTNSIQEMAELMLRTADLFKYMEVIIGNDSVKNPKPDPEMYLTAMAHLGVQPDQTVIVEDSPYGIAAARASGATVLEVCGVENVTKELFNGLI
jgi:beta-phosphoglucomutase